MAKPFTKDDPPVRWEFSGHAAPETMFKLEIFGRPGPKALTNIIRQLELYREFVSDDPAENSVSQSTAGSELLPPADPESLEQPQPKETK